MFARRTKIHPLKQIREFLWPSMGWARTLRYYECRLLRIKDTDSSIARGLSFGASISFTPLPGTHIVSAAALSWITRSNMVASVLGTLVGNPWTFPLMWWAAYKIGDRLFYTLGLPVREMPGVFTWAHLVGELTAHPFELVIPWVTGGFILVFVSWPVFYVLFYMLVKKARIQQKRGRRHMVEHYHPKETKHTEASV